MQVLRLPACSPDCRVFRQKRIDDGESVIFLVVLAVVYEPSFQLVLKIDCELEDDFPEKHIDCGEFHQMPKIKPHVFSVLCACVADFRVLLEPEKIIVLLQEHCRAFFVHQVERQAHCVLAIFDDFQDIQFLLVRFFDFFLWHDIDVIVENQS